MVDKKENKVFSVKYCGDVNTKIRDEKGVKFDVVKNDIIKTTNYKTYLFRVHNKYFIEVKDKNLKDNGEIIGDLDEKTMDLIYEQEEEKLNMELNGGDEDIDWDNLPEEDENDEITEEDLKEIDEIEKEVE